MQNGFKFIDFDTTLCRLAGKGKIGEVSGRELVRTLDKHLVGPEGAYHMSGLLGLLAHRIAEGEAHLRVRSKYTLATRRHLEEARRHLMELLENMPAGDAAG